MTKRSLVRLLTGWQGIGTALMFFVAVAFGIHGYFAKQKDYDLLVADISAERTLNRYDALRREEAMLLSIPSVEHRQLTNAEKARLTEIQNQLQMLKPALERLQKEQLQRWK